MTRMMTTGIAGVLLLAVGCGSPGATDYTLVSNVVEEVAPGDCVPVEGPYPIPSGASMDFSIVDFDDTDDMDVSVIDDAAGCSFADGYGGILNTASVSYTTGRVPAGNYDFVVHCNNIFSSCLFSLTWTATY